MLSPVVGCPEIVLIIERPPLEDLKIARPKDGIILRRGKVRGLRVATGGLRVLGALLVLRGLLLVAAREAAGVVGGPLWVLLAGLVLQVAGY